MKLFTVLGIVSTIVGIIISIIDRTYCNVDYNATNDTCSI
jgi:hypothetical protein